ncbi:MAG: general secretion pathway protein GspB [Candidatus Omnitrophica bacterium]|nr:general secretion pathway protein GspB [Candidatus Omnitrophota bacterium]MDD5573863.1 general secretion pathway protein GspB [Candidatus Omnitrophota bacterium]
MDQPQPITGQKDPGVPQQTPPKADARMFLARLKTDKSLWLVVIVAVFGFFLAAALFAFFSGGKKTPKVPAAPLPPPVAAPAVPAPVVEVLKTSVPAEPASALPIPSLSLSGILYSDNERLALINGKVVPEGGTVDGVRVEKIGSDEVELSFEGQKIILRSR